MNSKPIDPRQTLGLSPAQLPRHIAIIMDGNGRWARQRGLPRVSGHEKGAETVRTITTYCARLGIEALTLYSFSTENWKRPAEEVSFLMELYARHLVSERDTIMDNNIRFVHVGRRDGLPPRVLEEMDRTVEMSRGNTGLKMCLALNYGARDEILCAVRALARRAAEGTLEPSEIDEATFSGALFTAGLPDPDLLIRTANERRISNFLLWQISYAEVHFCETLWPDFAEADLHDAIRDFAGRQRRFGAVDSSESG